MARGGWVKAELDWDIDWHGEKIEDGIRAVSANALVSGAYELLENARRDTPIRTGSLRESGEVNVKYPHATVVFGHRYASKDRQRHTKHYAIPNHKREDYEHPRGGTHHYLERQTFPGPPSDDVFEKMADAFQDFHA